MFHKVFSLVVGFAAGILLLCANASAAPTRPPVPANLAGTWLITQDVGAAPTSALSQADAWSLLGSTFTLGNTICKTVSDSQEQPWLGSHGSTAQTLTFDCSAHPSYFGMQPQDDSHALMLVDGHYFVALKQPASGQANSADQNVTLKLASDIPIMTLTLDGAPASYPVDVSQTDLGVGSVRITQVTGFLMVDGHQTAAAVLSFTFGGTGWGTALCPIYDINGHKVAGQCRDDLGEIGVDKAEWQNKGRVIVMGSDHASDDPHCCGTLQRAWEFELDGTRFADFAKFELGREGAFDFLTARDLTKYFDMTSFPSSLGPQHAPSGTTLADFGFTITDATDPHRVTLENQADHWRFSFTVLDHGNDANGDNVLVCVEDQNIGGGSYHSLVPVLFRWNSEGDRLIGTIASATSHCPPLPGQESP